MASDCKPTEAPIPHDIIFNILSRLRVRQLCRLCCVSKSWQALISDPFFQQNHRRMCERNPLLLVTTIDDAGSRHPKITHSLLDKESRTLHPAPALRPSGLCGKSPSPLVWRFSLSDVETTFPKTAFTCLDLVCTHDRSHNVYICNPLMEKCIHLSLNSSSGDGEIHTLHVAFGYVTSISSYKVFRVFAITNRSGNGYNDNVNCVKFEVLTLGSNRRRAVEGCPSGSFKGHFYFGNIGITIDGSVYLLWEDGVRNNGFITVFDLKEEAWSVVPIPSGHKISLSMVEMAGQLCLAYQCSTRVGHCLELWLLKGLDENRPIWEKGCTIDISMVAGRRPYPMAIEQETGKILLRTSSYDRLPCTYKLLYYDPNNQTMEEIYSGQSNFTASFYIESFMSLDMKGFKNVPLQNVEWRPVTGNNRPQLETSCTFYSSSNQQLICGFRDEDEDEFHSCV